MCKILFNKKSVSPPVAIYEWTAGVIWVEKCCAFLPLGTSIGESLCEFDLYNSTYVHTWRLLNICYFSFETPEKLATFL